MSSKAPFSKKPTSQHTKPEFYWRGGNALQEREYLADEYKKALAEYRKVEFEYRQLERECAEKSQVLNEREQYTSALANYLDADAEGGQAEQDIKKQLAELETDIQESEIELQEAKQVHHPAVASGLSKEKAYLLIEMQRNTKAIDLANEQHENGVKQLAACMVSSKYKNACDLEAQRSELVSKKNFLRSQVNKYKKEFDITKPCPTQQSSEAKMQRSVLSPQVDLDIVLERGEEKKQRRNKKYGNRISRIIDQIEELNERMMDLGMDDDVVDTEELRNRYFPENNKNDHHDDDDDE